MENLVVPKNTTLENILEMLQDVESVTRPVSATMEEMFLIANGRLWCITNIIKNGSWEQTDKTCIDQEYDDKGNELH